MKKLLFFLNELKATFWFVPVLIIICTILFAIGGVYLDEVNRFPQDGLGRFFFVNSADSARSILTTISATMIGVAGTVFSVTLVALTLASSQFGPRLIKNFMYVRLNQIVLGSYISTYLYCLIVLNAIKNSNGYTFIPSISILLAIVAAFVNIILLIVFIHQIAVSIQADKVVSDISEFISKHIHTLFPEEIGNNLETETPVSIDKIKQAYTKTVVIKSPRSGYFRYIDSDLLIEKMSDHDGVIEIHFKPGDFLVKDGELGKIYTNNSIDADQMEAILSQFVIGKTKTAQQDLEFSIRQIVEIAVRALSPGVNDPFTTMVCIDNLTANLCRLTQVKFPSKYRMDKEKNLRVIAKAVTFEKLLNTSFNQIRQYSSGSIAVIIRLMEALITLNKFTDNKSYHVSIKKHADMVLNVGKSSISEERDLKDLLNRAKRILPV